MITQEKIVETATRLFTLHGVKSVTVGRLVKELHTSKRTIYNHFSDKTELLKASVAAYHEKVRKENEEIIREASNAIEAMGKLHHKILGRTHVVNPSFYSDILHYYPGVIECVIKEKGNYAKDELLYLAKWGIKDGIFMEDLDIEVVGTTVLHLLKLFKDNQRFPVTKFSKERLTFGIMLPYMRGLCTPKGLEILEKQEELFRVSI